MKRILLVIPALLLIAGCLDNVAEEEYLCIEWAGYVERWNMPFNCIDFFNNTVMCNWQYIDDDRLLVTDYSGQSQLLNCTKMVRVYPK